MINARSIAALVAPVALCGLLAQGASAQGLADLYKMVKRLPASELTRERIMALAVSRRRPK